MVRLIPTGYEALDTNSDDEDEIYRTHSLDDLSGYQPQIGQSFRALAPRGGETSTLTSILGGKPARRSSKRLSVIFEDGGFQEEDECVGGGYRRLGDRRMTVGEVLRGDTSQRKLSSFESDCHTLGTLTDKGTGRRYSAVVNINTGLPVALLGSSSSGSKSIEVRPISRRASSVPSSRSNSRNNSVIQLLNNPFGYQEFHPIAITDRDYFTSYGGIPMSRKTSAQTTSSILCKAPRRVTRTDYNALRERGNIVRMKDYKVINTSLVYIILFVVTGITFMAAWRGSPYALFIAAGLVVILVFSSCGAVKLHFYLKQRRSQKSYTAARRATICAELAAQESAKMNLSLPSVQEV